MPSVCRICLAGNRSLRSVTNNLLQCFYEKLTNNKLNSEDSRLRGLCSFCYQKLLKFHIFFEMAVRSENIFSQLYESGCEVTHEYIPEEYINLNAKQHLSVAAKWFVTIEDNATNAGSQVAIKDEPLSSIGMNEHVTTTQDKLLEFQSFPEVVIKSEIAFEEDTSDQENDTEELLSENIYIDQFEPDDSSITIKDEPLSSVDIKEEITTELDKLVEIRPFPEQSTRSRLIFEEDNDVGNDVGVVNKIDVAQTKPDDSKIQFNCNNCNKMFKRKSKLISHIRNCHSQFKRYSSAKKHTGMTSLIEKKTFHNQKPIFACNVCDKQCNHKNNLVSHIRSHSGERPYACHKCDKRFKYNSNLKRHVIIHTGSKPFACHVCDKQFYRKSNFVLHMTTHSGEKPYACHECDKRFNTKSSLNRHVKIHTGEKPFVCGVCNKKCSLKSNLVQHMRTHTDDKTIHLSCTS